MARISRPADPQWWGDYIGPSERLYHGTSWPRAQQILREGLIPWNQQDVGYHPSNYGNEFEQDWFEPRPDHVYMAQRPGIAREHAQQARNPETGDHEHGAVLAIDPTYLDPKLINPDEDTHPRPHQEDWPEDSMSDPPYYEWGSRGQMAEDLGYGDDPHETAGAIEKNGLIGYRGTIPPEAISLQYIQPNRYVNTPLPQSAPMEDQMPSHLVSKVSTWVDPLDELQQYMQGLGQAPEPVAPSVHHNSELDFVSEPVISPLNVPSPYPPGHEPKPVSDGPGGLSAGPTQRPNLLAKIKGFFKRTDAAPYPPHALNWRGPGYPGKGIYYNDTGQVFTWDVNGPDRAPHHMEMHQAFRPDWAGTEQDFLAQGHVPFNISPGGAFDNSWDPGGVVHPNAATAIQHADPRLWPGDPNDQDGFGHARGILDSLQGYSKYAASDDELHYALEIPQHVKDKIKKWVDEQNWPHDTEFEDPDDYHITLLYSADGHEDHGDADWLYPTEGYDVKVVALDTFGKEAKKPVVLRIESDDPLLEHANDLLDAAENHGLDISRFPGGYKPHLTVAYAFDKPAYARYPRLHFTTGPATVSEPRTAAVRGMGRPLHHIQPHVHYHPYTGLPCTCPWGQPADNKAKHPLYREAGSQNVRKLRNQNQKVFRDEYGQNYLKALDQLVEYHPDIEGMVPWIASRAKHGDVVYHPGRDELMVPRNGDIDTPLENFYRDRRALIRDDDSIYRTDRDKLLHNMQYPTTRDLVDELGANNPSVTSYFRPAAEHVADWAQWNNARQHPQRRGVVFDQLPVSELQTRVHQFKKDLEERRKKERWLENYGGLTPPIHTFDSGPHKGWTVNQLHNIEDCEAESEAMGHCIGQEGQPYRSNIDAGNISAFSLRDTEGYPHATWHYNPDGSLAHTQGRSGSLNEGDPYRNAISAWAGKVGREDDEVGEHDLDNLERDPCPDCGYQTDEDGDCENCGYPHYCPACGERGYDEDEGCDHCGHGQHSCPECGRRDRNNMEIDEDHPCEYCGHPHDSEIDLPPPQTVQEYDQQYHPAASDHYGLAQQEGNPGEHTSINPGTPDWEPIFQDAAGLHPRDQQHFFNTLHYNGHQHDFEHEVQQYLNHPDPDTWHTEDENNLVAGWHHNRQQHFNPQTQQEEEPAFDWGNGQYRTVQDRMAPQLWKENYGPELDYSPSQEGGWNLPKCRTCGKELHNPMSSTGQCTSCRDYEMWHAYGGGYNQLPPPGYHGEAQLPRTSPELGQPRPAEAIPATIGEPQPAGGTQNWSCPRCGVQSPMPGHCINGQCTYNTEPFADRRVSIKHNASDTQDPYICRSCMQPTLSEPKPLAGDWRWHQTCTNCGRSTSISPTHPIVQAIKNAQPQYPSLLNEVGEPRPLGEWMAHTGSMRYSAVRSWQKGQWGKGLVDNDDIVHVWPDTPEHQHVSTLLDPNPQVNFLVNPAGGFLMQGGRNGRDGWMDFISQAHPDLWPMPQLRTQPGTDLQDAGDDDMIV